MARKPNYSYERYERERAKAAKRQAKADAKAAARAEARGDRLPESDATPPGERERAAPED